jgi:hypothetical protein
MRIPLPRPVVRIVAGPRNVGVQLGVLELDLPPSAVGAVYCDQR